jgi:2'-5' RNA ligase
MRYIIHCLLSKDVQAFYTKMVNTIHQKFGIDKTKKQNLQAHFTLKYWFETDDIKQIEEIINVFCNSHKKTAIEIGPFNHFNRDVLFLDVRLSNEAKNTLNAFISMLKQVPWMPWDRYDGENLHPHVTVAENCKEVFDELWTFVKQNEQSFNCYFDNITILKMVGIEDGIDKWQVYKSFFMK